LRRSFFRRALKPLLVASVAACVASALALHSMRRRDREHARFYETGKSVNAFLGEYRRAVEEGFRRGDPSEVTRFYSGTYSSPGRGRWALRPGGEESGAMVSRLAAEGLGDFGRAELSEEVGRYFASVGSIDNAWCKIDMIEQVDSGRSVTLRVKFILDGTGADGTVFQDRHFYRWRLLNEAPPGGGFDWKIVRDELIEGLRVGGDGRGFVEVEPARSGIDFRHARDPKLDMSLHGGELKFDVMGHAFGGVSAADYDGDDRPDIFFPDGVRSRLYRNAGASGELSFVDSTAAAGLDGVGEASAALFADVDNDGDQDLFVARYLAPNKFFRNRGDGTFADESQASGLAVSTTSLAACFLDYDSDGFLDLYVGTYGDAFRQIPRLPFFAENAPPNRLFRNEGGRRFREVTAETGTGYTGWTMAVASADFDSDGHADIAVANDMGRKCLYRNRGDGTFEEAAKRAGVLDWSGGMGLAFGDFDSDGWLDLYTSNINSNQRWFGEDPTVSQYVRNVARTRWLVLDAYEYWKFYRLVGPGWRAIGTAVGEGNSLFRNGRDGTFTELKDSHTNRAGWGWGVAFADFDNDTDLDIYAANGWITNKSKDDL